MYKAFAAGLRRLTMATIQKPEVLFILGGPGAGKGTLCCNIVEKFGYVHLSAGELLREERAKPGSKYGELIETHIKNGKIVPVEITCSLLKHAMQTSDSPQKRFLVDGFPRNQDNVDGWEKEMSNKIVLKGVLYCDCTQEICTERCLNRGRIGSGRTDDNEESLKKRHETYIQQTLPIIQFYERLGLVYRIDATKKPDEVFQHAAEILPKLGW